MTVGVTASQRPTVATRSTTSSLRPRRRPWLLILGLLAMVVCAGAFSMVYASSDARVQALAVARPVAAGQTITAADLRVVRIVSDAGVEVVLAREASRVIGRTAAVPLTEGSLLADGQIGPAVWPPAGQAVVAVPVKAGRLAAGAAPGSQVLVIPVAKDAAVEAPPSPGAKPSSVRATVVQVIEAVDSSGTSVVSLLLPREDAVAVAGAAGELSLALAQG